MKKKFSCIVFAAIFAVILCFSSGASVAAMEKETVGFMKPAEAGFRNAALIYTNPNADSAYFSPLLVKHENGKPSPQAGYDAFLFLCCSIEGKKTETSETTRTDWEKILETYFIPERQTEALDEAVGTLRKDGFLPEDTCVPVIFAIPWLNPKVTDFGDVDGDGKSENLSRISDREKVLNWYMDAVVKRLERFQNLRLWGFYMMREGLGDKDTENAILYCDVIHKRGLKALWIPYFRGPGYERAYEFGFDVVIMQSNWTFSTQPHGEGARRNRLVLTADLAREAHMGVELEIAGPKEEIWRSIFRRTLETGTRTGFQQGVGATYFGSDFYWPRSEDSADRELYALWMDFLAGKPVEFPKTGSWKMVESEGTHEKSGVKTVLYTFREKMPTQFLDVFFQESEDAFFRGRVLAEGRETQNAAWKPLAYGFRAEFEKKNGIHQNFTLELTSEGASAENAVPEYTQLRITFFPEKGYKVSKIEDIQTEFISEEKKKNTVSSLSTGKPYSGPGSIAGTYPDSTGRELLDGVTAGNWDVYTGWNTSQASVELYAENAVTFDEIRIYTREEPSAGIHVPSRITFFSTRDASAELSLKGRGTFPEGFEIFSDFHYDPAISAMTGRFSQPVSASHVRLVFQKEAWLFLSEIQFFRDGKLQSPSSWRYTLSPQAASARERGVQYGDDGKMLTDGKISTFFSKDALGIPCGKTADVIVDLQRLTPVRSVTAHVLDGGPAGITLPQKVTVQFSADGKTWSEPESAPIPECEKLTELVVTPVSVNVNAPSVRYVKLNVTARTWAFLTEVEVH